MSRLVLQMELVRLVNQFSSLDSNVFHAVRGVKCLRIHAAAEADPVISQPCLYLVVQGSMHMTVGDEVYRCSVGEGMAVLVDLPIMRTVLPTDNGQPCLVARIDFDISLFKELAECGGLSEYAGNESLQGVIIGRVADGLLEAIVRLFRLLEVETPTEVNILGPMMLREVHYRFMAGGYDVNLPSRLSRGHMGRIAEVLDVVQQEISQPLRIEDLACQAQMSVSSFHHYFKEVTDMSPLQYQKAFRLISARQLMLDRSLGAGEAALAVGYESGSQFNREYARMFGSPPAADLRRLRTVWGYFHP